MAIDDPTAVHFVAGKIRPMADSLAQLYYMSKAVIDEYNVRGGTAFIPDTTDIVEDGADGDKRPVATGQDVTTFGGVLINLINTMEAGDLDKTLKLASNTVGLG